MKELSEYSPYEDFIPDGKDKWFNKVIRDKDSQHDPFQGMKWVHGWHSSDRPHLQIGINTDEQVRRYLESRLFSIIIDFGR